MSRKRLRSSFLSHGPIPSFHREITPTEAIFEIPMRETPNRSLFDYWNSLRGSRKAPKRSELEPSQFSSLLSHTFVLEDNLPALLWFRLAGSLLCRAHDKALRGSDFRDLFHEDDRDRVAKDISSVRETGLVGTVRISSPSTTSYRKESELILLPLGNSADQIVQYLGSWKLTGVEHSRNATWHNPHRILRINFSQPEHIAQNEWSATSPSPPTNPVDTGPGRVIISKHRQFRILDGGRKLC